MIAQDGTRTLLLLLTVGSVDDGKSTLIGRLLFECEASITTRFHQCRKLPRQKNIALDLSLITDGLRSEREQSITIDVAYRYFSTPRRI